MSGVVAAAKWVAAFASPEGWKDGAALYGVKCAVERTWDVATQVDAAVLGFVKTDDRDTQGQRDAAKSVLRRLTIQAETLKELQAKQMPLWPFTEHVQTGAPLSPKYVRVIEAVTAKLECSN
jgi:hypothetical protein